MKTLNDYFDKIYCVNLDRRVDRWDECEKEFKKHDLNVERFSAVDGTTVEIVNSPLNDGQTGCALSHLEIIKICKSKEYSNCLILEDDIQFDEELNNKLPNIMEQVPDDWDMLYFGGNHVGNNPHASGSLTKVNQTQNIFRTTHCFTTHSYAVKNKVYDKIISSFDGSEPIDICISKIQSSINCYIIRPHLAWQRPSYSDVAEIFTHYIGLKEDKAFVEGRPFGVEALKRDDVRDKLDPYWQKIYDKQKESGHHY